MIDLSNCLFGIQKNQFALLLSSLVFSLCPSLKSHRQINPDTLFQTSDMSQDPVTSQPFPPELTWWFYEKPKIGPVVNAVGVPQILQSTVSPPLPVVPATGTSTEPSEWEAFSIQDRDVLEAEYHKSQAEDYAGNYRIVIGANKLQEVNILTMSIGTIYWPSHPLAVRRANWFYKPAGSDSYHPLETELSQQVEDGFVVGFDESESEPVAVVQEAEPETSNPSQPKDDSIIICRNYELSGKHHGKVVVFVKGDDLHAWLPHGKLSTRIAKSFFSKSIPGHKIYRGFRPHKIFQQEQQQRQMEIDSNVKHLVFVIHGIGQKFAERTDYVNFIREVDLLREKLKEAARKRGEACDFQVIPVQWRRNLRLIEDNEAAEDSFDVLVKRVTLPSVGSARVLMTDFALDVFLYLLPSHSEKIINSLTDELNKLHSLFIQKNPSFTGKVSLVGHSLGSVLALEVLAANCQTGQARSNHLDFKVDRFFALGSPLGLFMLIKGIHLVGTRKGILRKDPATPQITDFLKRYIFLDCNEFYNIFHCIDPIANRIEPIVLPSSHTEKPSPISKVLESGQSARSSAMEKVKKTVMSIFSSGSTNLYADKQQASSGRRGSQAEVPMGDAVNSCVESMGPLGVLRVFNEHCRIDHVLSSSIENFEGNGAIAYWNILKSHTCYWSDHEVAQFIVLKLHGE